LERDPEKPFVNGDSTRNTSAATGPSGASSKTLLTSAPTPSISILSAGDVPKAGKAARQTSAPQKVVKLLLDKPWKSLAVPQ
jgi:hypothetical protein